MQNKLHPFPVTLLGAVVTLIVAVYLFEFGGSTLLLLSSCLLSIVIGGFVGRTWTIYPWQVALIGGTPGFLFLLWRLSFETTNIDNASNPQLFVFIPTVTIISTYLGALAGRWMTIRSKRRVVEERE